VLPWSKNAYVQGYAPREYEILNCGDSELIEIYKKLDYENEMNRIHKH